MVAAAKRLSLLAVAVALIFPAAAGASRIFYTTSGYDFQSGGIWSVRPGGPAQKLRSAVPEGPGGVVATLSRDGKHIFCLCRGTEIDVMKLDGSGLRKVGRRPAHTRYDIVELTPTGEPIWFKGAYVMTERRDGSHPHSIAKGYFEEAGVAIARQADRIAFSDDRAIYVAPLGGGPKTKIYRSSIPGSRFVGDMSWSADGKKLVFVDYPEEEKYEAPPDPEAHAFLYAGGKVRELPLGQEAIGSPIFSPDQTKLASVGEKDGSIFTGGLDGGPVRRIVNRNCSEETGNCLFWTHLLGWLP